MNLVEMFGVNTACFKRISCIAIAAVGISTIARTQEAVQYIYPGHAAELRGATLCPLPDGGFYLARLVYDFSVVPPGRFVVERMAADGEVEVVRGYHNGSVYSLAMQHSRATPDEGLIAIGKVTDQVSLNDSICVLRLAASGEVLWSKAMGFDATTHEAAGILPLADGGFLAYGSYRETTTNKRPVFVVKFNATGDMLWSTTLTSNVQFEHFNIGGVLEESNGDLWLAGQGRSSSAWLLRADASGTVQQRYALDLPGVYDGLWGDVRGLFMRSDGDFDLFYSEASFDAEYDISVVRINTSGQVLQTRSSSFTGNAFGMIPLVCQLENGDYLFSGDRGGNFAYVGLIDQQGEVLWVQGFQYPGHVCEFRNPMPTPDGAVRVHAYARIPESDTVLEWLLRTSQWDPSCYATALEATSTVGTGSSSALDLMQGPGPAVSNTTAFLLATEAPREAICGSVGIREAERPTVQVFPNPASGAFQVVVPLEMPVHRLRMFDPFGRTVDELAVMPGQRIVIDAPLASGLYSVALFDRGGMRLVTSRVEVMR